jgi:probable HAF family extracellular repeat protein
MCFYGQLTFCIELQIQSVTQYRERALQNILTGEIVWMLRSLFNQRAFSSLPVLTLLLITGLAHAAGVPGQGTWETTLQPRDLDGDGTTDAYYDTVLDITWLADADLKATLVWDDSQADGGWPEEQFVDYLAGFGHLGVTTWRLPASDNPNQGSNGGELEHMYLETLGNTVSTYPDSGLTNTGAFANLQPTTYLYGDGVFIGGLGGDIYSYGYGMGYEANTSAGAGLAWAVADGDVQPISQVTPAYELIDLGTLGGLRSYAYDINNNGQIVGNAYNASNQSRAFLHEDGSMQDLGTLMLDNSGTATAYGINNSGDVTGTASADAPVSSGLSAGFLYTAGDMSALGVLPTTWSDSYISAGKAINNTGVIAVNSYIPNYDEQRFGVRATDGTLAVQPVGGQTGGATAINSAGLAIGDRNSYGMDYVHLLFSGGIFSTIASDYFDSYSTSRTDTRIYAINDSNQLVGSYYFKSCGSNFCDPITSHGLLTSTDSLPVTGGNHQKVPGTRAIHMINAGGDMAGKYANRWVVRQANGASLFIDEIIDTSGWDWAYANLQAMNDHGDIVGYAKTDGGQYHALLLRKIAAVTTVEIDVDPFSTANEVRPTSDNLIAVAVLSTNVTDGDALDFDATQVNPSSLKFGLGEAANIAAPWPMDVGGDGDGDTDVLFGFSTQETGVLCGDTEISLAGETYAGELIKATDTISTTDCTDTGCHP